MSSVARGLEHLAKGTAFALGEESKREQRALQEYNIRQRQVAMQDARERMAHMNRLMNIKTTEMKINADIEADKKDRTHRIADREDRQTHAERMKGIPSKHISLRQGGSGGGGRDYTVSDVNAIYKARYGQPIQEIGNEIQKIQGKEFPTQDDRNLLANLYQRRQELWADGQKFHTENLGGLVTFPTKPKSEPDPYITRMKMRKAAIREIVEENKKRAAKGQMLIPMDNDYLHRTKAWNK